ncbi:MAG: hypothetical protein ACI4XP_05355 [Acutalibacteraceae bacterium]
MDMSFLLKSKDEINELADSGMFNSIIEGYIRFVFADLELSDKLNGYSFSRLFDSVSAADARRIAVLSAGIKAELVPLLLKELFDM